MTPLWLLAATHLTVAAVAFLVGTWLRAHAYRRSLKGWKTYAEGILKASAQTEHAGYQRGDRNGFNRALRAATIVQGQVDELFGYDQ